ncbi:MAG TPA: hypothetical protein VII36_05120, partial [Usitatibacter sp.]
GFENIEYGNRALLQLSQAGVPTEHMCTYRVNPPGMHDRATLGGDREASPGALHEGGNAGKGAVVGAAAGLAAAVAMTPFIGPAGLAAGVGVGAYTASLLGGLEGTSDEPQPGHGDLRPAEMLVAVHLDAAGIGEPALVRIFEECGAWQVERADGRWDDGVWIDFDPVTRPHLIGGRDNV